MRRSIFLISWLFIAFTSLAQNPATPDKIYGELFTDVQMSGIFDDSKTFVDCIPKRDPSEIVKDYQKIKSNPNLKFSLKLFVENNFILPSGSGKEYQTKHKDVVQHIHDLWPVLSRKSDTLVKGSSLLPLPNSYIVPGGRFREIYYWDSYFTMLGLKESGHLNLMEDMVKNFAFLIHRYGHIPNGNRSYYLSRSQPPFFSLMVDLLAEIKGPHTYVIYQPALEKEYDYWMDRTDSTIHIVNMPDGSVLNRYYDQLDIPRQESWREDVNTAKKYDATKKKLVYRDLRSAAESGWDFSSRWFRNPDDLSTIQTTDFIPVDLNALLYHLEKTLARSYDHSGQKLQAAQFEELASRRKAAINKYCWSEKSNWYLDHRISSQKNSTSLTLAGMFPFYFGIADTVKMKKAVPVLEKYFLKPGGLVTTTIHSGQQWDAPNGWAPLQWISITALEKYGQKELAMEIAKRWVDLNKKVFGSTGKLMEKYNVVDTDLVAGGGEYPSQDGFGWTNGVLLALIKKYQFR